MLGGGFGIVVFLPSGPRKARDKATCNQQEREHPSWVDKQAEESNRERDKGKERVIVEVFLPESSQESVDLFEPGRWRGRLRFDKVLFGIVKDILFDVF